MCITFLKIEVNEPLTYACYFLVLYRFYCVRDGVICWSSFCFVIASGIEKTKQKSDSREPARTPQNIVMMKIKNFLAPLAFLLVLTSCSSIRVATDYDREANFNEYQSFAFYKPGIDKADVSDLDKKRILRAIESEMIAKGFTKSENPDLLVSIFTKTKENINIYQNNFYFFIH